MLETSQTANPIESWDHLREASLPCSCISSKRFSCLVAFESQFSSRGFLLAQSKFHVRLGASCYSGRRYDQEVGLAVQSFRTKLLEKARNW